MKRRNSFSPLRIFLFSFILTAAAVSLSLTDLSIHAASASSPPESSTTLHPDIKTHPSCPFCGMDRQKFARSRMLITWNDGRVIPLCSLHCAAVELSLHLDHFPEKVETAAYDTHQLINAETAVWIVGGELPGVMTTNAKWAFADKASAEAFQKASGGQIVDFDEALETAYKDMSKDVKMIRQKRKKKRMGKAAQGKTAVTGTFAKADSAVIPEPPGPDVKCPVCGMFPAKYPSWLAAITFSDGTEDWFDGAKDMFKYYFDLNRYRPGKTRKDIIGIFVTDYYDARLIPAQSAQFVIGSDVYGPMGNELIPHAATEAARDFMKDHTGNQLLDFSDITSDLVHSLDQ